MTSPDKISKICAAAKNIRRCIIDMCHNVGRTGAHLGGSLSLSEIMASLYCGAMNFDISNPSDESRDRLILSKGHGILAQYAALHEIGLISDADILSFKTDGSKLGAHPSLNPEMGIEFSSGSLGQGLSLGVGAALALKMKENFGSRVFVILGDGECDEGQIWEAAMSAAHFKLDNLVAVIDANALQYDGRTDEVMSLAPIAAKFSAFGFDVREIDGHSVSALLDVFSERPAGRPLAVIAKTVKGSGVSFAENKPEWHNGVLSDALYKQAIDELEAR